MKNKTNRLFPMYIDISGYDILVIGGGKIATRRVGTLLKFAEQITLVAPSVSDPIKIYAQEGKITWIQDAYSPKIPLQRDMVFIATDDEELNRKIAQECKALGVPVNVSSDKSLCDFHFPGVVIENEITIGINASGTNHSKAKEVRQNIENMLQGERKDG